jgi:predicted AlkP superfamily pyrophosphatase or phosphodiesterase
MRKSFLFLPIASILFSATLFPAGLEAQVRKKKVIFIIADGIPADALEKAHPDFIDLLSKTGGYKRAYVGGEKGGYTQTPTISAVGYNSLLTGTWVNKHNVLDNDIKEPDYHYPTIFRLLKQVDPSKKTAVFSTWLDNRTKLVGDSIPQTGDYAVDYHADGYELDTVRFPHDKESQYIHRIDELVTDSAESCLRVNGPDLTWLYLEYTDDMGHRYGDGAKMNEAIGYVDKQVQRIWAAIQYRQKHFPEDWMLLVTTDHGRDSIGGKNHGGQSARERTTWIATNVKGLNSYWDKYQPAVVDILPTMARWLNLTIPRNNLLEMDGTPLIGKVSVAEPVIQLADNKLDIRWKALEKEGWVKIWLSTTNNYQTGGRDSLRLLLQVPVAAQSAMLGIGSYPSDFYKIVLEAPYNALNRWIRVKK